MAAYTVSRCPCGYSACKYWHVNWVASVQGVKFTEAQAIAVAALLNEMEAPADPIMRVSNIAGDDFADLRSDAIKKVTP